MCLLFGQKYAVPSTIRPSRYQPLKLKSSGMMSLQCFDPSSPKSRHVKRRSNVNKKSKDAIDCTVDDEREEHKMELELPDVLPPLKTDVQPCPQPFLAPPPPPPPPPPMVPLPPPYPPPGLPKLSPNNMHISSSETSQQSGVDLATIKDAKLKLKKREENPERLCKRFCQFVCN